MGLAKRFSGWIALRDGAPPASNPTSEVQIYSESGVAKVRQPDGTIITIANATPAAGSNWDGGTPTSTYGGTAKIDFGGVT